MYDYSKVIEGISEYIDNEILSKINDWRKWIIGAGVGVYLAKSTETFNAIKENQIVKSMGIVDSKSNKVNVDLLYSELKKQAKKSAITFDVPMIGPVTLNESDVDKLYKSITK